MYLHLTILKLFTSVTAHEILLKVDAADIGRYAVVGFKFL